MRPLLGDIELQQVQKIDTDQDQVLTQHSVPALEGDFLQGLGRRATRVTLSGVLTGPEVGESLKTLRDKFRAAEPVPFVADITTATQVDQVLIEEMGVRELAGKPERFEYVLTLREFILPPAVVPEEPPEPDVPEPPDDDIDQNVGTLIVEVIVEGQPNFDFSQITVTAQGTQEDGTPFSFVLTNRESNIWTEEEFPTGELTVEAVVTGPQAMSGSKLAVVRAGETTQVQIVLQPGAIIAKAFLVHLNMDKAFLEPCMRLVMKQVAEYAQAHPDEKLVIIGHTDLVGSAKYNLSLSERRGRSAYAYLTFGRDRDTALAEWNALRRKRPTGVLPSINDTWDTREYQYILQDLGHYLGNINGKHDDLTDSAVRAFQTERGLTVDGDVGDGTWAALIEAYLEQDSLAVAESQFFPNCDGEILKWLGCGERDPVKNTQDAWRPNRRAEFLFVKADSFPCEIPKPDTFDLPEPGVVGSDWCLGPGDPDKRCCFTTRDAEEEGKWLIQPTEPGTVTVRGSIRFSDGTPAVDVKYVLIAPDGEFMDGERAQGSKRGDGIPGKTKEDGTFAYPDKPKGIGVYTLQIEGDFVAHLEGQSLETAKGNVVCKRLDGTSDFNVIVTDREVAMIRPSIIFELPESVAIDGAGLEGAAVPSVDAPEFVVVKKDYTDPKRRPIVLRVDSNFDGNGELTITQQDSPRRIRFFDNDGNEITNGQGNTFRSAQLLEGKGHTIFAEGNFPSSTMNDVIKLKLLLIHENAPGIKKPIFVEGLSTTARIIAVELRLGIAETRSAADVEPPLLSTEDKIKRGIAIQAFSPVDNQAERARLRVGVTPLFLLKDPEKDLILRHVHFLGDPAFDESPPVLFRADRAEIYNDEVRSPAGDSTIDLPHARKAQDIPLGGLQLFVEGRTASGSLRDSGFMLGIKGLENDGDRVTITVRLAKLTIASPIVLVRKPHTSPARQAITLRTTAPFNRSGTLTRSGNTGAIRLFTAATGGTEITNTTNHVFTGAQLSAAAGVQVFAEGVNHSEFLDDVQLTLTLEPGLASQAGPPATATLTAVELTLDIAETRTSAGVDPPLLSQTDKVNVGRFILPQDATFSRERAILVVGRPNPLIPDDLVLAPLNAQVEFFAVEDPKSPAPPQTPLTTPHTIPSSSIPAGGLRVFLAGRTGSSNFRDTGCQLGIAGVESDGDRVAVTVLGADPSQPGLFAVGEHEYTEAEEGTFILPRPGAVADDPGVIGPLPGGTPTFTIRRRAVVRYPANSSGSNVPVSTQQASYPLIVLLHGNHRRFQDDRTTFVESYRGLEYLARHLASHGYIALTIDVDDINQRADGIFHRGAAVLEHIQIMVNRNTAGPPAPGQVDFTSKIDLSHIGLIGHSRGGEGVLAAQQINVARSLGHNINGIVSIAPTNARNLVHNTTPLLVLYGSSDGDVRGSDDVVNPFLIYGRAAPPKAMIFVYAAIHNRFSRNADWLNSRFIDNDDDRIISEGDHQNIAKGYVAAFFERHFIGRAGFDTFFKNFEELASVSAVEVHQQVQDPTRLVVDNFEQPAPNLARPLLEQLADRASTNNLGQPVSESGLVAPSASLIGAFTNALTETNLTRTFIQFFVHDGAGAMVAWDTSGDMYETTLSSLDVSSFAVLAFRVTQRLGSARNPSGTVQDFSVRLTDTAGQFANVRVGSVTSIPFPFERHDHVVLHPPPVPLPPPPLLRFVDNPLFVDRLAFSKSALKTIRLSLDSFTAVNASLSLGSLQTLAFVFDQTGSGEIAIDDIEFSN